MLKNFLIAQLLFLVDAFKSIKSGKSVWETTIEVSDGSERTKMVVVQPRETTHYITKNAANFDNNNIVDATLPKKNGIKTFSHDQLDNDFLVSKIRILVGKGVTDTDLGKAKFENRATDSAAVLPDSIKNTNFVIEQDQRVFDITVREAFECSGNGAKWLELVVPFKLRAKTPFAIRFNNSNQAAYAADEAYRVEISGLEYVVNSAATARNC